MEEDINPAQLQEMYDRVTNDLAVTATDRQILSFYRDYAISSRRTLGKVMNERNRLIEIVEGLGIKTEIDELGNRTWNP